MKGSSLLGVGKPEQILSAAYVAFNDRDLDAAIELMHPDVDWPNAWEGGRVRGRVAVREYWERQFGSISSEASPERFSEGQDGTVIVDVRQIVRDPETGRLLANSRVRHQYRLDRGLIVWMDVLDP
jgi:hypothetical protein